MYITFTRKTLALILLFLLMFLFLVSEINGISLKTENAKTNQNRINYAKSVGYETAEAALSERCFVMPQSRDFCYKDEQSLYYNLNFYAGCFVKEYSYNLLNKNGVLTMLTYKNRVIACKVYYIKEF